MSARLAVLGLILLVVLPIVVAEYPHELARWYVAAANERFLDGDLPGALNSIDKAFEIDRDNSSALIQRAEIRGESHDWEGAISDYNRAVKLYPDSLQLYLLRGEALQKLGRHKQALDDWQTLEEKTRGNRLLDQPQMLNNYAYVRAVANTQLDDGLSDANESIAFRGGETTIIATFGYFEYLRGNYESAKKWLDIALQKCQAPIEEEGEESDTEKESTADSDRSDDTKRGRIEHYRALVFESLGHTEEAEAARKRAAELGHKNSSFIFRDPDIYAVAHDVVNMSAVMDTRGYIQLRRGKNEQALEDLDLAVTLVEGVRDVSFERQKRNEIDLRVIRRERKQFDESVAVIRYHRMLVLENLGRSDDAERDRQRVIELGFEPNDELF